MSHDSAALTGIRTRQTAPGPRGYPLLGILPHLLSNGPKFLSEMACRYGDVVYLPWGAKPSYLINQPDYLRYIFQDNHRNYGRDERANKLKALLGEGLVTVEGEAWRRQRRLMQPAFHRQQLAGLAAIMLEVTDASLERWRTAAEGDRPLDMLEAMVRVTRDIIVRTLFSTEVGSEADRVGPAAAVALKEMNNRAMSPIDLPERWPTPGNRRFQNARRTFDQIVYGIIDARRRDGAERDDLLGMLLNARDEETGEAMGDQQLRDEVTTLFLAGHETTAIAVTWAWYALATQPDVERRLHAELDRVLGGRPPTFEDLPQLAYTRWVFEEALRLYPSGWLTSRAVLSDDEIGGYHIPAKAIVLLCPYTMHRHPAYWENPERFDPERFSEERSANRPRFAYFPFGGGPRMCIGNHFAVMEAQLILATIAQEYRFTLVDDRPVEFDAAFTLRPRHPLLMRAQKRSEGELMERG